MSNNAIIVENLSKSYQLGEYDHYYDMRDAISDAFKFPFRYFSGNGKTEKTVKEKNFIWALKDINFEVKHGEIVGIIGRNGAGKSTLLKILSRITYPSEGKVMLNGRVGSLLEVGTGFHPELTGRENIFLNGSILGMSRKEIERKFDEIVDFAEVEKFLDTPVKRYSSGMYVRLAFAVAAHLEPEILLVDEVLAVGDTAFQKKCLGKMDDISSEGRTVLFVSHNMGSIKKLCPVSVYLKNGEMLKYGETNLIVSNYISSEIVDTKGIVKFDDYDSTHDTIALKEISLINHKKEIADSFENKFPFYVKITYDIIKEVKNLELSIRIETIEGITVLNCSQSDYNKKFMDVRSIGRYSAYVKIPENFLTAGSYQISVAAYEPNVKFYENRERIIVFNIMDFDSIQAAYIGKCNPRELGLVIANFPWLYEI